MVAFSLSTRSGSTATVLNAGKMVIHLLRYDDINLAKLGATPGADRFGGDIPWQRMPTGEPRFTDVTTWFRAEIRGALPTKQATVVVAELLEGASCDTRDAPEVDTLIYMDRRWHRLREPTDGSISLVSMEAARNDCFR